MTKKNKLNEKFELTFSIRSIAYYFLCIYLIYVFKVTSPGNMTHLGIYMVSCFIGAYPPDTQMSSRMVGKRLRERSKPRWGFETEKSGDVEIWRESNHVYYCNVAAAGSRRYPDPVFQCAVQAPLYGARAGAYRRDGCAEPCGLPVLPHPVLRRFFVPSGQHLYRPDGAAAGRRVRRLGGCHRSGAGGYPCR